MVKKSWENVKEDKTDWLHVVPVEDTHPHNTDSFACSCNPHQDGEYEIIIHNAFDGREAVEEAESILRSPHAGPSE